MQQINSGSGGEIQNFKAGTLLIRENDLSRKLFIVKKGNIRIFNSYLNHKITLAILGEGEIFGELSFLDSEPRSASAEALTDVEALVIDAEKCDKQLRDLPTWVFPVIRTAFRRLREADRKITVFQSMNEFQKKSFQKDNVAKTIYMELLRFNKTIQLVFERQKTRGPVKAEALLGEAEGIAASKFLGLRVYWRLLVEHDFVDAVALDQQGAVQLRNEAFEDWNRYLGEEIESERFTLLGHASIAVLRKLVTLGAGPEKAKAMAVLGNEGAGQLSASFAEIKLDTIPLYQEALEEFSKKKILVVNKEERQLTFQPGWIAKLYLYQSLVKAFDHTIVNFD